MRRQEREVTDKAEIESILAEGKVLRIAMHDGVFPYIVPVNYGYEMQDGKITLFFHGAKEGKKHVLIEKNPHVAIEMDCEHHLIQQTGEEACSASYAYASIIGQGMIERVKEEQKAECLDRIMVHYGITSRKYNPNVLERTWVYKIELTAYTAKRRSIH